MPRSETRADRNKRIACEAIALAERSMALAAGAGQAAAHGLEADLRAFHIRWETRGVDWTRPRPLALDLDGWVTADELARFCDVRPNTVRQWASRGIVRSTMRHGDRALYSVADALRHGARAATG